MRTASSIREGRISSVTGFADWLAFGAEDGVIAHNEPVYQEKLPP